MQNSDGVLKVKKLQKLVKKSLQESGVTEDKDQLQTKLMGKVCCGVDHPPLTIPVTPWQYLLRADTLFCSSHMQITSSSRFIVDGKYIHLAKKTRASWRSLLRRPPVMDAIILKETTDCVCKFRWHPPPNPGHWRYPFFATRVSCLLRPSFFFFFWREGAAVWLREGGNLKVEFRRHVVLVLPPGQSVPPFWCLFFFLPWDWLLCWGFIKSSDQMGEQACFESVKNR